MANISNNTSNTILTGTSGDDSIENGGSNVTLDGGAGNDSIFNDHFASLVAIDAGAGDDSICNFGRNVLINTGDGNNSIENGGFAHNVTINSGKGNDYLRGDAKGTVYIYNGGNDTIENFNQSRTLVLGSLTITDCSFNGTGDWLVKLSNGGSIFIPQYWSHKLNTVSSAAQVSPINVIENYTGNKIIKPTVSNNYIINNSDGTTITAILGNNVVMNGDFNLNSQNSSGHNVKIQTGAGDDDIRNNNGNNVTIDSGAGKDVIYVATCSNCTVNMGADDDIIWNDASNGLINGEDGNDFIGSGAGEYYSSENMTIYGGAGNDTIYTFNGSSDNILDGGAGNDTISNNGGSNFTISGGEGNDFIASNAQNVTINGGEGVDTISNNGGSNFTISGGAGSDYIYNSGSNVLFQYNSGDGNDYIYGFNTTSTLQIGGGIGTYSTTKSGSNIIVTVDDSRITLVGAATLSAVNIAGKEAEKDSWKLNGTTATYGTSSKTLVTVSGVKSLDGLSLNGTTITLATSSLNQENITVSNGYTLALADDVATSSSKKVWSKIGTTATYNQTSTAGYTLASDAKSINYTAAANKTLATVSGIKSTNGLSIDGKVITVSKAALGTNKVTVSDGYTLALAKNVTKTSTKKTWSLNKTTASYKQTNAAGYKLSNNVITYTKKAIKTLATVSGVKAINGLSIDGKVITVSKAALGTNKVTVSNGYTLALAKNVTKTSTKKAWSLNKTTASYKQTNAAGYKLSNNVITYTKKATKTLATVTGVKSTNGLSIDGKVITVSKAALGTNKVTVSDGYTLALAKNVTKTSTKKTWSLNKTTASYNQATTAGYKLAGDAKSISYAKKATKTLATVSGVKSTKGFTLSGETIELATTSLSSKVTVSSDDYGFDFASTYKKATITGSGSDDTITSAGQKIIINGGAGNDSIVNKGKNSTINAGAGNDTVVNSGADTMIRGGKGNDSLIGGKGNDIFVYAQGDGNDVITNYDAADRISIESSAVNVLTNGNNVVFTVGIGKNQGKITLQKAKGKTITYFVGDEEFVYPNDNVKYNAAGTAATLKAAYTKKKFEPSDYSNYASTLVTIDASPIKHTLKITGNDQANKITGTSEDDTIYGGESSDTILSGVGNDELHGDARNDSLVGSAGDDSLWGGKGSDTLFGGDGADTFIYQNGDGKDTIADFARGDVVMILSGKVGGYIADKSDVIFKIGTGQITFQNSVDKYIELVDKEGNRLTRYIPTIFSS